MGWCAPPESQVSLTAFGLNYLVLPEIAHKIIEYGELENNFWEIVEKNSPEHPIPAANLKALRDFTVFIGSKVIDEIRPHVCIFKIEPFIESLHDIRNTELLTYGEDLYSPH